MVVVECDSVNYMGSDPNAKRYIAHNKLSIVETVKPSIEPEVLVMWQHPLIKKSFYLVVIVKKMLEKIVQKSHGDAIVADNAFSSVLNLLTPIVFFEHSFSLLSSLTSLLFVAFVNVKIWGLRKLRLFGTESFSGNQSQVVHRAHSRHDREKKLVEAHGLLQAKSFYQNQQYLRNIFKHCDSCRDVPSDERKNLSIFVAFWVVSKKHSNIGNEVHMPWACQSPD